MWDFNRINNLPCTSRRFTFIQQNLGMKQSYKRVGNLVSRMLMPKCNWIDWTNVGNIADRTVFNLFHKMTNWLDAWRTSSIYSQLNPWCWARFGCWSRAYRRLLADFDKLLEFVFVEGLKICFYKKKHCSVCLTIFCYAKIKL